MTDVERRVGLNSHCVIAIDGPAASGKSTVARQLAQRVGFVYVNSGAMYRALTWFALEHNLDGTAADQIADLLGQTKIRCRVCGLASRILINDLDPAEHLRDARVNNRVSRISAIPQVRKIVDDLMRQLACDYNVVVEGRDIGSIVFPETPYKFYVDASPEVRQRRRAAEGQQDEIAARDRADSSRVAAPLVIAEDALVIDSSHLTIDGVVGEIVGRLKVKGLPIAD
ncbi:MAG: (d)CMP kinase [Chthoniobacterales bacterium]